MECIQHHRLFALGYHLPHDVDGFGLEALQVGQVDGCTHQDGENRVGGPYNRARSLAERLHAPWESAKSAGL